MSQLTFWSEEPPARASQSPEDGRDSRTSGATSPSPSATSPTSTTPHSSSGRTSPASSPTQPTLSGVYLPPSRGRMTPSLSRGGRVLVWFMEEDGEWRGSLSMRNTLVFRRGVGAYSCLPSMPNLSDVLERNVVLKKYSLSGNACKGILLRAEKKSSMRMPQLLKMILQEKAVVIEDR